MRSKNLENPYQSKDLGILTVALPSGILAAAFTDFMKLLSAIVLFISNVQMILIENLKFHNGGSK